MPEELPEDGQPYNEDFDFGELEDTYPQDEMPEDAPATPEETRYEFRAPDNYNPENQDFSDYGGSFVLSDSDNEDFESMSDEELDARLAELEARARAKQKDKHTD